MYAIRSYYDDHGLSTALHRHERLQDHRRRPDDLERVVDTETLSQLANRSGHVADILGVDGVGRAELLRPLKLLVDQIDGNDPRRRAQSCSYNFV